MQCTTKDGKGVKWSYSLLSLEAGVGFWSQTFCGDQAETDIMKALGLWCGPDKRAKAAIYMLKSLPFYMQRWKPEATCLENPSW